MNGGRERRVFLRSCDGEMDLFARQWEQDGDREREAFVLAAGNVPCAYMPVERQEAVRDDLAALRFTGKIFAPPEIEIQPGTAILLRRQGRELRFVSCGSPVRYPSHQEIYVQMDQWI